MTRLDNAFDDFAGWIVFLLLNSPIAYHLVFVVYSDVKNLIFH